MEMGGRIPVTRLVQPGPFDLHAPNPTPREGRSEGAPHPLTPVSLPDSLHS